MKILQVITSLHIGGAEKLLVDMCPLFKERGHQIDVLLFDGTETLFKEKLQEMGINVYHLSKGGFVYNPLFIARLILFLGRYDIVHTHNTACQYFVVLARLFHLGQVKLVTTEHSTSNRRRDIRWFKAIDKIVYKRYNAIVSISAIATQKLINYIGCKKNIYTITNGINVDSFMAAKSCERRVIGLKDHVFIITMVAGFRQEKNQDALIRTIALLPRNFVLCLVGDGIRRSVCEALAKNLKVEDRVVFTGIRSDIPQILKASDIIVMSSYYEGLSLSSIEGMAAGKPFIAANVNGLREITEGAGILFEEGDDCRLASEIEHLMKDPDHYRIVAERCLQRASTYDISKTVELYEALYLQILTGEK